MGSYRGEGRYDKCHGERNVFCEGGKLPPDRSWDLKLLLSLVVLDKIISYFIFFGYQSTEPYASCYASYNPEEFNTWKKTITPSILASSFVQLVVLQMIWRYGEELVSRVLGSLDKQGQGTKTEEILDDKSDRVKRQRSHSG